MVQPSTDKLAYILIGKESVWGTPVACTKDIGLVQSFSPNPSNAAHNIHTAGQSEAAVVLPGLYKESGSLEVVYQNGRLFEYIMGSVTHDATTTPDIKHTYTVATTLPSMSIEYGHNLETDVVSKYEGVKLNSLTLNCSLDGELRVSADWVGETHNMSASAGTPVISTLTPLTGYQATLQTGPSGGASTVSLVQSASVTINRSVEARHGTGNRLPKAVTEHNMEVSFSFDLFFYDKTQHALFLNGTTTGTTPDADGFNGGELILNISNGVTAGSGLRQVYLKLDNVIFDAVSEALSVGSTVTQSVSGIGKINTFYTYDNITSANW